MSVRQRQWRWRIFPCPMGRKNGPSGPAPRRACLTIPKGWFGRASSETSVPRPHTTKNPVSISCVLRRPGGHGEEPQPDPFPNSAVKLLCANGTSSQDAGESGAAGPAKHTARIPRTQSAAPQQATPDEPKAQTLLPLTILPPAHHHLPSAGWSSPVARQAHNLKAAGSNPAPATIPHKQKAPDRINGGGFLRSGKQKPEGKGNSPQSAPWTRGFRNPTHSQSALSYQKCPPTDSPSAP